MPVRWQCALGRVCEHNHGGGTSPFDLDEVLPTSTSCCTMQMKVGQQVAKQRIGSQTVGQRLSDPRGRHQSEPSQLRTHRVRPAHPTLGSKVQTRPLYQR